MYKLLVVGDRRGSSWWREVSKVWDGESAEEGAWFEESVARQVGNEVDTFFWRDLWLESVPLNVRFSRLFDLSNNKTSFSCRHVSVRVGERSGGLPVRFTS
jgi:hypothetical protein